MKKILLGNEAIVQGALEAGVDFVSTYPGTPASEIGNIFSQIAKEKSVYFEFSTNEKVALEAAIGASFSGLKCLVAMKNFGLNVALDALLPFCYTGVKGPVVIIVADDPSCWSSAQSEENSRAFAYLAHIPILEPADAQEAKDFVKLGFEISEKFNIPVIVRTTTRVAHQRMPVTINPKSQIPMSKTRGRFIKDVKRFVTMPPKVLEMKEELLEKIEKIREFSEKVDRDPISTELGRDRVSTKLGIITSGISYLYVREVLEELSSFKKELSSSIPVLKLDFFYPLPEKKIKNFIKGLRKVLVVEELEPYLEKEIARLAKEVNCKLEILGKNLLPQIGELRAEIIAPAITELVIPSEARNPVDNRRTTGSFTAFRMTDPWTNLKLKIPKRFPCFCPGCPHTMVLTAIKKAAPEGTIFGGDIGCYMIAGFPPHNLQDYLLCMGASVGVAHGIKKSSEQKVIALIGDSTFFHAGIPALINAVYNKSNPLIVVMDNQTTAMTGHQPNPGEKIKIENIVRACGVKNVKVIDPVNIKEMENTIKEFLTKKEVSVIVARRICALLAKKLEKNE